MALSIGQAAAAGGSSTTATTASVTSAASGSTFIICAFDQGASGTATVSDSKSNSYTQIGSTQYWVETGYNVRASCFRCESGTGGSGHTFTVSGSYPSVFALEIVGSSPILDGSLQTNADTTDPFVSASVTNGSANAVIVMFVQSTDTGYTSQTVTFGTSFSKACEVTNSASYWTGALGYRVVSSVAAYSSALTFSGTPTPPGAHSQGFSIVESGGGGGSSIAAISNYYRMMRGA